MSGKKQKILLKHKSWALRFIETEIASTPQKLAANSPIASKAVSVKQNPQRWELAASFWQLTFIEPTLLGIGELAASYWELAFIEIGPCLLSSFFVVHLFPSTHQFHPFSACCCWHVVSRHDLPHFRPTSLPSSSAFAMLPASFAPVSCLDCQCRLSFSAAHFVALLLSPVCHRRDPPTLWLPSGFGMKA